MIINVSYWKNKFIAECCDLKYERAEESYIMRSFTVNLLGQVI
jgi:hypothetical protein